MAEKTPLPKNYFAGTEFADSMDNERRALLAYIAERGTEGAAAYQRAKKLSDKARAGSLEKAAARGAAVNSPTALRAKLQQDYDSINMAYRDALAQSQLGHGREMDRIGYANSAYKDAMIAAQPGLQAAMDAQIRALELQAAAQRGGGGGGGGGGSRSGSRLTSMPKTMPEEAVHEAAKADPKRDIWAAIDAGSLDPMVRPDPKEAWRTWDLTGMTPSNRAKKSGSSASKTRSKSSDPDPGRVSWYS